MAMIAACSGRSDVELLEAEIERARVVERAQESKPVAAVRAVGPGRVEVVLPPSPLRGANGIACRDRRAFVAEALADRISEIRADGSTAPIALPADLQGPDDLAFDAAGNLLVTAASSGAVWQRSTTDQWTRLAENIPGANAVAISHDDQTVFVSQCFSADGLLAIRRGGSAPPRVIHKNLGCPNAMFVDTSGKLVVPLTSRGEVVRIEPTTGARELLASGLHAPTAAKAGPQGEVLVVEGKTGALRSLGSDRSATVVAQLQPGLDDLALCGESVLVTRFVDGAVYAFKPWPGEAKQLVRGGLAVPTSVAAIGSELLVADGIAIKRVREGRVELVAATVLNDLPPPVGIAVGAGSAVVTSSAAGGVYRLTLDSGAVTQIAGDLEWPTSVAILPEGDVLVVETGAGQIVRIDAAGAKTVFASGLMTPVGLAVRGTAVYTTELTGGRLLEIDEAGSPRAVASGLDSPIAVAAAPNGDLLVLEAGAGRLSRVRTGASRSTIADGFSLLPVDEIRPRPGALAVDSSGAAVVATSGDGGVVRILAE